MAGLMNRKRPDNRLTVRERLFSAALIRAALMPIPLHHNLSNDLSAEY
jgi:hypothetical protein